MLTASLFSQVRGTAVGIPVPNPSRDRSSRPIFLLAHPFVSFGRQGSYGPPNTQIEDSALSDQRSVKVDDALLVLWSAEILQKTEFELFETAYRVWYREEPEVARLERIFADYMFEEVVPFWVRQFARTTLDEHDGWRTVEEMAMGEYLGLCLRGATTTILSTTVLALSLFLPRVIFPWIDADYAAFPA